VRDLFQIQTKRRAYLFFAVAAFLILHGCVGQMLPMRAAFWSSACVIAIELIAMFACLGFSLRAADSDSPRMLWRLTAFAFALEVISDGIELHMEFLGTAGNPVPGLPILMSTLYAVPLLMAISLQFDARTLRPIRIVHGVLSAMTAVLFCVLIFSVVSIEGSTNLTDILFVSHMFDALDLFLAIAATIRVFGANEPQERFFFYVVSCFLWGNTIFPAIHNRILIKHDFVWLDLLLVAPYLLLLMLLFQAPPHWVRYPQPSHRINRAVRSGSPIFLSLGLLLLGIAVSRRHFYVGAAGVLVAIVCYGALNILAQSRRFEVEESLLATKKELEGLVSLDSLTGIPNRRAFDERIDMVCRVAYRFAQPVSLLMIDIDFFKRLNDTGGHLLGDQYLMQIAQMLSLSLPRANDLVARYGGEEFAVLLPATAEAGAAMVASRLQDALFELGLEHPSAPLGMVTVSIGMTTSDVSTPPTPIDLIRAADKALYRAKALGRNRTEFLAVGNEDGFARQVSKRSLRFRDDDEG
jgi:diguanylate cyclase (GGDEF)-like protein